MATRLERITKQRQQKLERIRALPALHTTDPVQAFCDFLHHRYVISSQRNTDVWNDEAFDDWVAAGQPGYPLA